MDLDFNFVLPEGELFKKYGTDVPAYWRISELVALLEFEDRSAADKFCRTNNIPRYKYRQSNRQTRDAKENLNEAIVLYESFGLMLSQQKDFSFFEKHFWIQEVFPTIWAWKEMELKPKKTETAYDESAHRPYGNQSPLPSLLEDLIENQLYRHLEQQLKNYALPYPKKTVPRTIEELKLKPDGSCSIPSHILKNDSYLQNVIRLIILHQQHLYEMSVAELMAFCHEIEDMYPEGI